MTSTKNALKLLRRQIERHRFLFIVDEVSTETGFAVFDRRGGRNLGTWIESADSLRYLVKHGAEAWLVSVHNGQGQLAASAEEQRREQLIDLAIEWALVNTDEMNEVLEHEDGTRANVVLRDEVIEKPTQEEYLALIKSRAAQNK